MLTASRKIHFDTAHRVMGHENKCRYLHGHRFVLEVSFAANDVDSVGRIIDFGVIKEILGKWVEDNWDHNVVLAKADLDLGEKISSITDQKIFYLDNNPTAENLAEYLMSEVCPKLFAKYNVICTKIKLYETPNCFVEVEK